MFFNASNLPVARSFMSEFNEHKYTECNSIQWQIEINVNILYIQRGDSVVVLASELITPNKKRKIHDTWTLYFTVEPASLLALNQ